MLRSHRDCVEGRQIGPRSPDFPAITKVPLHARATVSITPESCQSHARATVSIMQFKPKAGEGECIKKMTEAGKEG